MSCAEVMEGMHRYLDHDLSREEAAEMFRHIDGCPDCAEHFAQLKLLSMELEQLPDVRPPFSLVDAILPRLAEIDRRGEAAAEEDSSSDVVPVIPPPVPPPAQMARRSEDRARRRRGLGMAGRTGIGAAAAVLILGIALFNMPKELPDAQVENSLMTGQESAERSAAPTHDGMAAQDAAADSGVSAGEAGTDAGASADLSAEGMPPAALPSAASEAPTAASNSANAPDQADLNGTAPLPDNEASTPDSDKNARVQERLAAPQATPKTKTPSSGGSVPSGSTPDEKMQKKMAVSPTASPSAFADEDRDREPASASIMAEPGIESSEEDGGNAGIMSLAPSSAAEAVRSWTSPDGLYAARLENGRLDIYSIPSNGTYKDGQRLASLTPPGKWVSGGWSADGLGFVYTTRVDGEERTTEYRLAGNRAASPSASPAASAAGTNNGQTNNGQTNP